MPIYQYVCQDCAHPFEELVFGSEVPRCPACASEKAAKQFSVFAVPSGQRGPRARGMEAPSMGAGPCGTCGDVRGPGACSVN